MDPPGSAFEGIAFGVVGAVEEAGGGDDVGPAAGLAEVIDAGPEELPGKGGVVAEGEPGFAGFVGFGANDFAGGVGAVGGGEFAVAVILADDIDDFGEAVVVGVIDVGAHDGDGDGTRWIELMGEIAQGGGGGFGDVDGAHGAGELVEGGVGILREDIPDFVAQRIEDDGGVIAVGFDDGGEIALVPVFEIEVVIGGFFADGPGVEGFIHDEEAEAVAEVVEFRGHGCVGGADGVDTVFF